MTPPADNSSAAVNTAAGPCWHVRRGIITAPTVALPATVVTADIHTVESAMPPARIPYRTAICLPDLSC